MKKNRIATLLLVTIMVIGMLPTTALAADMGPILLPDAKGKSYTIQDGLIKLSAPNGYQGTEVIDSSISHYGKPRELSWTVEGKRGTLHVGQYTLLNGIWIDGGSYLDEVILEVVDSPVFWPGENSLNIPFQFALRVSNSNLMIQGQYGTRERLRIHQDSGYLGDYSESEIYGIVVDDGDVTIIKTDITLECNALADSAIKTAIGFYVPDGNITADIGSFIEVNAYKKSSESYAIFAGGTFLLDGGCIINTRGDSRATGALIHASSIRFGYNFVSIDQTGYDARPRFSVEPMYVDSKHTVDVLDDGNGASDYRYKYTGSIDGMIFGLRGMNSGKMTYLAGEDFDESGLNVYAQYEFSIDTEITSGYTILNGKNLQVGTDTILIEYQGWTAAIPIQVLPNPNAPVVDPNFRFEDVPETAWYYDDVMSAHTKGLIDGKSKTIFAPNDNMTISEVVKLAACMHQLYHKSSVTLTNGIDKWYSTYMAYAVENGITATDLSSRAGEVVTRQEYISIFYKALPENTYVGKNAVKDGAIPDVAVTAPFASEIYRFYRAGILTGTDKLGSFQPSNNITRCEIAAILIRMMDESTRKTVRI